jgi:hypothetical protein
MLSLTRPTLAFPSGFAPGFNPSHPAAKGMSPNYGVSAIALPTGNFVNLLTGIPATIPSTVGLQNALLSSIGPCSGQSIQGDAGVFEITGQGTATPTGLTMALIAQFGALGGGSIFLQSAASVSILEGITSGSNILFAGATPSPTITYAANTPYFIAASASSAGTANVLVLNLSNGEYKTSSGTAGTLPAASSIFYIANGSTFSHGCDGYFAAAMWSPAVLSLQQLLSWADDPWAFWYPKNDFTEYELGLPPVITTQFLFGSSSAKILGRLSNVNGAVPITGLSTTRAKSLASLTGSVPLLGKAGTQVSGLALGKFAARIAGTTTSRSKAFASINGTVPILGIGKVQAKALPSLKGIASIVGLVSTQGKSSGLATGKVPLLSKASIQTNGSLNISSGALLLKLSSAVKIAIYAPGKIAAAVGLSAIASAKAKAQGSARYAAALSAKSATATKAAGRLGVGVILLAASALGRLSVSARGFLGLRVFSPVLERTLGSKRKYILLSAPQTTTIPVPSRTNTIIGRW